VSAATLVSSMIMPMRVHSGAMRSLVSCSMQTTTFRGGQEVQTQLFLGRTFHSTSFAARALVAAQQTKASQVQAMLQRGDGVTLGDIVAATGWLPHTARAALTGLCKKGHAVTSEARWGSAISYSYGRCPVRS
jgi:hypothetical protein